MIDKPKNRPAPTEDEKKKLAMIAEIKEKLDAKYSKEKPGKKKRPHDG